MGGALDNPGSRVDRSCKQTMLGVTDAANMRQTREVFVP